LWLHRGGKIGCRPLAGANALIASAHDLSSALGNALSNRLGNAPSNRMAECACTVGRRCYASQDECARQTALVIVGMFSGLIALALFFLVGWVIARLTHRRCIPLTFRDACTGQSVRLWMFSPAGLFAQPAPPSVKRCMEVAPSSPALIAPAPPSVDDSAVAPGAAISGGPSTRMGAPASTAGGVGLAAPRSDSSANCAPAPPSGGAGGAWNSVWSSAPAAAPAIEGGGGGSGGSTVRFVSARGGSGHVLALGPSGAGDGDAATGAAHMDAIAEGPGSGHSVMHSATDAVDVRVSNGTTSAGVSHTAGASDASPRPGGARTPGAAAVSSGWAAVAAASDIPASTRRPQPHAHRHASAASGTMRHVGADALAAGEPPSRGDRGRYAGGLSHQPASTAVTVASERGVEDGDAEVGAARVALAAPAPRSLASVRLGRGGRYGV
jgi:hypothetical protein